MDQLLLDLLIIVGGQFWEFLDPSHHCQRYYLWPRGRSTDHAPDTTTNNKSFRSTSTWAGDNNVVVVVVAAAAATAGSVALLSSGMVGWWWYRSAIQRRLKELRESTLFGCFRKGQLAVDPFRMIRTRPTPSSSSSSSSSSRNDNADIENHNHKNSLLLPVLALNRDFVEHFNKNHSDGNQEGQRWKLMSLGEYLSTLRPYLAPNHNSNNGFSDWIAKELQASLAMVLLQSLGPRWGAAFLPGIGIVHTAVQKLATNLASWVVLAVAHQSKTTTTTGSRNEAHSQQVDRGGMTLSLSALSYAAEVNYQRLRSGISIRDQQNNNNRPSTDDDNSVETTANSAPSGKPSPLELLRLGEVGYEISFGGTFNCSDQDKVVEFVPSPFIVSEHWNRAIQNMEQQLAAATAGRETTTCAYDPHSKELPAPMPIDERFFPDLHTGWGAAECTHTQRQILENRLLAVLLNRLASNYYHICNDPVTPTATTIPNAETGTITAPSLFQVVWTTDCKDVDSSTTTAAVASMDAIITKPGDLVRALVSAGHSVEACVRTQCTTFGLGLCVKETPEEDDDDDSNKSSWTNIPLAYFLLNGYADADGNDAFVALPHSGLNLEVRGPLLSGSIQHYMAIEGLCGWHSNVPWVCPIDCGAIYRTVESVVECVRVAALEAGIVNAVAADFRLPLGGYGLTGVCNDSAARIEYAISGQTHVYPLSFHGKFAMHTFRTACHWRDGLLLANSNNNYSHDDNDDVQSLNRLIHAIVSLPCDLTSTPVQALDQFRRQWHCQPPPDQSVFALTEHSRKVMQCIQCDLERADRAGVNGRMN